jgi:putative mRNA 3-end processing factor
LTTVAKKPSAAPRVGELFDRAQGSAHATRRPRGLRAGARVAVAIEDDADPVPTDPPVALDADARSAERLQATASRAADGPAPGLDTEASGAPVDAQGDADAMLISSGFSLLEEEIATALGQSPSTEIALRALPLGDDDESFERATPPAPAAEVEPAVRLVTGARDFEYLSGVHLSGTVLWFDCERKNALSFLSHAHAEFAGKNRRILATEKTVKILSRGAGRIDALTSPFRRPFTLGPLLLELHPAGHVLGSAQVLVERDGRRVVYTSDVLTRGSLTAERARAVPCDAIALPATYGLPMYRFPDRAEVAAGLVRFVERCLEDAATPVLIAEQIGLAQEVMRILGEAGHRMRVHGSIYDVAKVYVELGVNLPNVRRFGGSPARDEVVIFPPILRKHAAIRKLKKYRTAIVSGRAVEPGFAFVQRVDEAFPLADAVDHAELHAFVDETGARDVYLTGGHVEAFGAELRARGLRVFPLVPPVQLALF